MKETELAQKFVDYLSDYDLYFEVDYAGHTVDIVAITDIFSTSLEVKTSFNFKVFEQALTNKPYFNYSYIGVPCFNDNFIQRKLCKDYGIGLLIYDTKGYNDIREIVVPKFNRISNKILRTRLHEFNKTSKPGSKNGDSNKITAFGITVDNITKYVKRHEGCTIKEMIENISHHYDNNRLALNSTYQWIKKGIIKDVVFINKKLYINENRKLSI